MSPIKISKEIVEKTKHSCTLTKEDLLPLLKRKLSIPSDAEVRFFFHVPGGGDWSSEDIDISTNSPIHVEWISKSEKKSEETIEPD